MNTQVISTLIASEQPYALLAVLAAAALLGYAGDARGWYGKVSGVLVTVGLASLFAGTGLIPSASGDPVPVYGFFWSFGVYLAIPLLLLQVRLRSFLRDGGKLAGLFAFGVIGVSLGALLAGVLFPDDDSWSVLGGVLTATYTGGSVNFIAVSEIFRFSESPLFVTTMAVDNLSMNLFMAILLLLPTIPFLTRLFAVAPPAVAFEESAVQQAPEEARRAGDLSANLLICLIFAAGVVAVSLGMGSVTAQLLSLNYDPALLYVTLLALGAGHLFPNWAGRLAGVGNAVGMFLLFLFLAVIGAATDVREVFAGGAAVLVFAWIILLMHLAWMLLGARLLRADWQETAIASMACVGGPPLSGPLAASLKRRELVPAAIVVGLAGYAIGTFLGSTIASLLMALQN